MELTASYLRPFPGLAEAVAACRTTPQHTALLECLRRVPALEAAKLATTRGDMWLHRRMVFSADGRRIAEDHEAWLAEEVARDGGDVAATCTRLDAAGHRLSKCHNTNRYIVVRSPTTNACCWYARASTGCAASSTLASGCG